MHEDATGKIGTLDVRLAPRKVDVQRYERRYVPVTPASHEIVGANAKVAPDTTVAEWHIGDFSAGEGDSVWHDRGRYNSSDGASLSDAGDGMVLSPNIYTSATSNVSALAAVGSSYVTGAADMGGTLFNYSTAWTTSFTIGGTGTGNVVSIAAPLASTIFVCDSAGNIRKVLTGSNTLHYATWGGLDHNPALTVYDGVLYGLDDGDLYSIDQTSATTRTLVAEVTGAAQYGTYYQIRKMCTTDVGLAWLVEKADGVYIYEYNVADDTSYVVGKLDRGSYAYDILFWRGIYFVGYRDGHHTHLAKPYLYFQQGGTVGNIGPFDNQAISAMANTVVKFAGIIGDRLFFAAGAESYAYDLSTGAISTFPGLTSAAGTQAITNGRVLIEGGTTEAYYTKLDSFGTSGEFYVGRYDFGYLGLDKTLTKITVTLDEVLATGETVYPGYKIDDGTLVHFSTSPMIAGQFTKSWVVSTDSLTARGQWFELYAHLAKTAIGATTPKVTSFTAEAVGSESRLEWILLLDVSDNNEQHGHVTVDGLKALKTAHAVVEFGDPWQVLPHVATEMFDVTVEEVNLPDIMPGADPVAVVRLRAVETV